VYHLPKVIQNWKQTGESAEPGSALADSRTLPRLPSDPRDLSHDLQDRAPAPLVPPIASSKSPSDCSLTERPGRAVTDTAKWDFTAIVWCPHGLRGIILPAFFNLQLMTSQCPILPVRCERRSAHDNPKSLGKISARRNPGNALSHGLWCHTTRSFRPTPSPVRRLGRNPRAIPGGQRQRNRRGHPIVIRLQNRLRAAVPRPH